MKLSYDSSLSLILLKAQMTMTEGGGTIFATTPGPTLINFDQTSFILSPEEILEMRDTIRLHLAPLFCRFHSLATLTPSYFERSDGGIEAL